MRKMAEDVLSKHGWLARQPKPFRRLVLSHCQLQEFKRGTPIYHLGDESGGIFGIVSGALAVSIAPGESGPHFAHLGTRGAWFGEGPFLTGEPRRVSLASATDSLLMNLPLPAMERMAADDPEAIRRFGQIAISNLDIALGVINDLMIAEPERRIAAALTRSASNQDDPTVRISQSELGTLANASRKLVNQALQSFAAADWAIPGYGTVEILDLPALKDFASGGRP